MHLVQVLALVVVLFQFRSTSGALEHCLSGSGAVMTVPVLIRICFKRWNQKQIYCPGSGSKSGAGNLVPVPVQYN